MKSKFAVCMLTFILVLQGFSAAASTRQFPPQPSGYYGTILVDDNPAAPGVRVIAQIAGVAYTTDFLVHSVGQYGLLYINGDDPDTPGQIEGGGEGDPVSFRVIVGTDTLVALPTAVWQSGVTHHLDLNARTNWTPEIASIPVMVMNEDTERIVVLNPYVNDPDDLDRDLTWSVISQHPQLFLTINNLTKELTINPDPDWFGNHTLELRVEDPNGASAAADMALQINPVNDAPTFAPIPAQNTLEDTPLQLDLSTYVNDVDNLFSEMNVTYETDAPLTVFINYSSGIATLTPNANWFGQTEVTLIVSDPAGESAAREFRLAVTPVNDAPQIESMPPVVIDEDSTIGLPLNPLVIDPDHADEDLTWSVTSSLEIQALIDSDAPALWIWPIADWYGQTEISLIVEDPAGAVGNRQFTLIVNPINDAPRFTLNEVNLAEDVPLTLNLSILAADVDNNPSELVWGFADDPHVELSINDEQLQISPELNWFGQTTITATVTDPNGLFDTNGLLFTVEPVNDPPQLSNFPGLETDEDTPVSIMLNDFVADVDNAVEDLSWSIESVRNVNVEIDPETSAAVLTPAENWYGTAEFTIIVNDPDQAQDQAPLSCVVWPVNDPPLASFIQPVETDTTDLIYSIRVHVFDPDNSLAMWLSVDTDPVGFDGQELVSIQVENGENGFNWNVTNFPDGAYYIHAKVVEGGGLEFIQLYSPGQVVVYRPPQLIGFPAAIELTPGAEYSLLLNDYVTDSNDPVESLVWTIGGNDAITIEYNPQTGACTFRIANDWLGAEYVTFTVLDPDQNQTSITIPVVSGIIGDLNRDFFVDMSDIQELIALIMELNSADLYQHWAGDLNRDNVLTIQDVLYLLGFININ